MPKKPHTQDSPRPQEMEIAHAVRHNGMTTEELGDAMIQTVQQMSPDEKAHLRAKLDQQFKKK